MAVAGAEGGSESLSPKQVADILAAHLPVQSCAIVPQPATTAKTATTATTATTAPAPKARRSPRVLHLPIHYDGHEIGALHARLTLCGRLRTENRRTLRRVAAALGPVVHAMTRRAALDELDARVDGLADELQTVRLDAIAAQDEERRALERNLHDGAQHHIVALRAAVGLLEHDLTAGSREKVPSRLRLLADNLATARMGLLATASGTLPAALVSNGLIDAFDDELGARTTVSLDADEKVQARRYPLQVEVSVFYACLEAVNNATKHAPGAHIGIVLRHTFRGLRFEVDDDGPGFDTRHLSPMSGLVQLGDRLAAVGGELVLRSEPGVGTSISGFVPL